MTQNISLSGQTYSFLKYLKEKTGQDMAKLVNSALYWKYKTLWEQWAKDEVKKYKD